METALVSIIMPMYNAGKFLSKSIESVLEQTYQNWELLLIDDGSNDDSIDIALAFMEKDSRIFLLKNEQNMGIAKTRNKGIEASKGQYIAFLDSDDLWLPNKLEVQIKWMEEKKLLFTCSSYFVCNENGNITHERNFSEGPQTYQDLLKTNTIGCLTVVVESNLLKRHLMPDLKHEDYATWLNILKEINTVYFINEKLAIYRKLTTSTSSNKWNTISWVWKILRQNEQFSVIKSSFYLMRFLFYTTFKYAKNE